MKTRGIRIERDVPYLEPGRTEKMDVYMPVGANKQKRVPGIVVVHGGGWLSGGRADERERNICRDVSERGYVCASISYTLATESRGSWPQALYDCKTAARFLRQQADHYGIDPNRIGMLGCSAGGHLAAMAGLAALDEPAPDELYGSVSSHVQAVVALYGVYNLKELEVEWNSRPVVEIFLGVTKGERPELWMSASPHSHIGGDAPPFLLIHGTEDSAVPAAQSIDFSKALRAAGVVSELVLVQGAEHSFDLQPVQQDLCPVVVEFLDKTFDRTTGVLPNDEGPRSVG